MTNPMLKFDRICGAVSNFSSGNLFNPSLKLSDWLLNFFQPIRMLYKRNFMLEIFVMNSGAGSLFCFQTKYTMHGLHFDFYFHIGCPTNPA